MEGKPEIYLDGDVVSSLEPEDPHGLFLPSGDGKKGGTFEMWFNLEIEVSGIFVVGVLHPDGFIGRDATQVIDRNRIVIDRPSTVDLRLNALDLGYPHFEAIELLNMDDYTVSGTLFNPVEADLTPGLGF